MNVLVLNAGSSSLKYQLINVETHEVLAKGICERVGSAEAFHKHGIDENEVVIDTPMPDHNAAMALVLEALTSGPTKAIDSLDDIDAVGHRVVQGGKYFDRSVLIDDDVVAKIDELAELAPLHNKAALMGIEACREQMPGKPMVAVFDTSFFQTIPPKAYMYPLPYELYEKHAIRKYGAHGTSHRYIAMRTAEILGERLEDLKLITCHLGGGCSVTAIDHGMSVDTSMGFTPLGGVMMGSRCGDIDPSIVTYLMEQEGYTPHEINEIMNRESGLLGISGLSSDLRDIKAATIAGHKRATLAYDMYSTSVKKTLGAYIAELGGVDAISFAGGVGEHCERMRRMILSGMESLGIILDYKANKVEGEERVINDPRSKVKLLVVPTNEELMIARDTARIASEAMAQEHA